MAQESTSATLPQGFVYLQDVDPTIIQEMRYAGNHNFIGTIIDGYHASKCILTNEAAQALAKVQAELQKSSLSLKVYDCYRPQRAVNRFISWARDIDDTKMKHDNSLDFGTGYDCLDILSHPASHQVGIKQKQNRLKLQSIMKKNGFRSLETEWWHYTLNQEPFSDQYFDFEIW